MFFLGNPEFTWWNVARILSEWNGIIIAGSFLYSVVAVNAGHHGLKIVHEGDEFMSLDFGFYQLGTVIDRTEAGLNLFMSLTHFGDHLLHHLFPALDHSLLPHLRETLIETCKDFEWEMRQYSCLEALVDQFKQLSRTVPNKL